jgi:rare lipoprotein A
MRHTNLATASISKSIIQLAIVASFSFVIFGCSAQAPNQPPLSAVPPAAPSIIATPPKVGPGKVTTASFYGPALHGHATSSGEIYDPDAMTAASRTLPMGSHARVTNLKTGKSVVVRINDRGPFVKGRGIDLSRAAAHEIGIDHRGVAKVRVARIDGAAHDPGDSWSGTVDVRDTPQVTPTDYSSSASSATKPGVAESDVIPSSIGSWSMEPALPSAASAP